MNNGIEVFVKIVASLIHVPGWVPSSVEREAVLRHFFQRRYGHLKESSLESFLHSLLAQTLYFSLDSIGQLESGTNQCGQAKTDITH
ncbi:hypothetical protein D3C75_1024050 [compost metagenome]